MDFGYFIQKHSVWRQMKLLYVFAGIMFGNVDNRADDEFSCVISLIRTQAFHQHGTWDHFSMVSEGQIRVMNICRSIYVKLLFYAIIF